MFPELNAWKIISGLIRVHFWSIFVLMLAPWLGILAFQSTYAGMDTTFRFEWIACQGKENVTWIGGFDWECS